LRRVLKTALGPHFSPNKIYINRSCRTAVVLNPKVGSTSFRYTLTKGLREVQGRKHPSGGILLLLKKAREFPFAPARDYFHALAHPEQYEFYCFVRNPYARLKSAWIDKLAYGHAHGYPRSIRGWRLDSIRRYATACNLPGGEKNSPIPFATFMGYVEFEPTGKRNHHWDEQYTVLMMDRIAFTRAFKIETEYVEGMKHIFRRVGLDDPRVTSELDAPRNSGQKRGEVVFTQDLADRALRIFARDFETFGYPTDSWQGM
jgi:sulfotransferase famil protein